MGLQVRLRHPLGDRLIELTPTPVQKPVVVGRTAAAEVQVPSAAVAPKHCVLFVHKGRWAVQDSTGEKGPGTFVNGRRIEAAAFLKVGDKISLGPDAKVATIEIDPDGPAAGRSGYALADSEGASAVAPAERPVRRPPPQATGVVPQPAMPPQPRAQVGQGYPAAPPQPTYAPRPTYAQAAPLVAAPVAQPWGGGEQVSDGDTIQWQGPSHRSSRSRAPKKKPGGSGMGGIAAALVGALVAGGGVYYYFVTHKPQASVAPSVASTMPITVAVKPTSAPTVAAPIETKSNNIFGIPDKDASASSNTVRPIDPAMVGKVSANAVEVGGTLGIGRKAGSTFRDAASYKTAVAPTAAAPTDVSPSDQAAEVLASKGDKRMDSQEWRNIATAYYGNPLDALLKMDDYEQLHPSVLAAPLNTLRDGVLDRLWFERIDQLWKQREALGKKLREIDRSLVDETNESFKQNTIIPEKKSVTDKFNGVSDVLQIEMGFSEPKPPLLHDDTDLSRLRKLRDPATYVKWQQTVIESVHRRHVLPFEGE